MRLIEYDAAELTPAAWRSGGAARAFNPTIAETDDGYVIAYRIVQVDSEHRRIATARLDRDLALVPGSVVPLSDEVEFADPALNERALTWHADPIFLRLRGSLYLTWNDGANRPRNHQFLAPMTADGQHFAGAARELATRDRRSIEKNWTLFDVDGEVYASYSYRPHRVLRVDLDSEGTVIIGTPVATSDFASEYERVFGIMRGGAQPVRIGDSFVAMAHSSYKVAEGRVYRGLLIEFEAKRPFRVRRVSRAPFDLPSSIGAQFKHEKLNPDVHDVIYPRGMVRHGADEWIVTYGVNDEECAIAVVPGSAIDAAFGKPVFTEYSQWPGDRELRPIGPKRLLRSADVPELPVFWFDAKGKLFDGFAGGRRFAIGNFGDIASRWVSKRVSGVNLRNPLPGQPRLLAIGSVLHRAQDGDVVWGSGVKGGSAPLEPGIDLDVRAVRGPISLDYLQQAGISTDKVTHTFDPGVLLPHLYATELATSESRGGDRIIPHYHDDLIMRRKHPDHSDSFVSVDTTPLGMMRAIKGADRVFASSLHGIIFAEAMGIPAYWLAPVGGEDELKYYDYYFGTGRTDVKRFESLEEAMASEPMPLPEFDIEAYLATFPHDAVPRLTTATVAPGQRFEFKDWGALRLGRFFSAAGFDARDRGGIWMTAKKAALRMTVRATPGEQLEVTFGVTPSGAGPLAGGQVLRMSANGGPVEVIRWRKGGRGQARVTLGFTAESAETVLQVDLTVDHLARSPRLASRGRLGRLAADVASAARILPRRGSVLTFVSIASLSQSA
ncbi:putative GH43/DUF377 family glycosyl hydrolase [Microbacterium terrae]|uniref:Polysaccharide pyruvyl transferase n=1 Tax=Microbacterium terrae TaxID=69369 RepID=A0A0M2H695_9MICO|nr:polysaccharide pyruvyl transferase family protein [Microbacterium terrae]KJL39405.1 Polysaccharide pyruvyl transferase [Microbacterium terrae]MBP1078307.1 putative GH43/DUF377 family glycosyl hydrolase [Microbacterium terrae]GLJ97786.1 hypothetical protein GCM10017594_09830 [Microbacterium terrae]